MNFYAYAENDPVNLVDPTRYKPGDAFGTPWGAVVDAFNFNQSHGDAGTREYGGWLYTRPDGKFSCTEAPPGTAWGVNPGRAPAGAFASYHNHPCFWSRDMFSDSSGDGDKPFAHASKTPIFLFLPDGKIKVFAPLFGWEGMMDKTAGVEVPYPSQGGGCGCGLRL